MLLCSVITKIAVVFHLHTLVFKQRRGHQRPRILMCMRAKWVFLRLMCVCARQIAAICVCMCVCVCAKYKTISLDEGPFTHSGYLRDGSGGGGDWIST